jgi:hypothetical protein
MLSRMSKLGAASTVALCACLVLAPAPAVVAKEHGAGCLTLPTLLERLRNTMLIASVHRARGSAIAAYEVLRTNLSAFLRETEGRTCGTLPALFDRAIGRADAAPSAVEAGAELDLAYAAALALAIAGRLPSDLVAPKRLDVPESAQYGEDCPDLFALVRRLDAPGTAAERRDRVLADLRAHPRCPRVKDTLENAKPADLGAAVDAVVLDELRGGASEGNPIARCPELPLVLERLADAIAKGAPLYNRGDHESCRILYDGTARALTDELIPVGRCPVVRREIAAARAEAAQAMTASEAAWAFRHGFDRITESVGPR